MNKLQSPASILDKVKLSIFSKGPKTIRTLGKTFRQLDSYDGIKRVSKKDFLLGLINFGISLPQEEAEVLLNYIDIYGDGFIDFEEFLIGVRGALNKKRQSLVDKAFLKFDKDGNGTILASDLRGVYNCSMHPKVQKGEMTEDQVFIEFLSNFADINRNGSITRDEWNDFYAAVSASIDCDEHFVQLMKNVWRLE